jgi:hypothetical protein
MNATYPIKPITNGPREAGATWSAILDTATQREDYPAKGGYAGVSRYTGAKVKASKHVRGMGSDTDLGMCHRGQRFE